VSFVHRRGAEFAELVADERGLRRSITEKDHSSLAKRQEGLAAGVVNVERVGAEEPDPEPRAGEAVHRLDLHEPVALANETLQRLALRVVDVRFLGAVPLAQRRRQVTEFRSMNVGVVRSWRPVCTAADPFVMAQRRTHDPRRHGC
jgi:hypothetical protein